MSYNHTKLFETVHTEVHAKPLVSLGQLEDQLHIERHTIERTVREITGYSFREYQQITRLHAAQVYLATRSNLSVKEIAALLGYLSPRAFSKFFRSKAGLSPVAYRSLGNNQCVGVVLREAGVAAEPATNPIARESVVSTIAQRDTQRVRMIARPKSNVRV